MITLYVRSGPTGWQFHASSFPLGTEWAALYKFPPYDYAAMHEYVNEWVSENPFIA